MKKNHFETKIPLWKSNSIAELGHEIWQSKIGKIVIVVGGTVVTVYLSGKFASLLSVVISDFKKLRNVIRN